MLSARNVVRSLSKTLVSVARIQVSPTRSLILLRSNSTAPVRTRSVKSIKPRFNDKQKKFEYKSVEITNGQFESKVKDYFTHGRHDALIFLYTNSRRGNGFKLSSQSAQYILSSYNLIKKSPIDISALVRADLEAGNKAISDDLHLLLVKSDIQNAKLLYSTFESKFSYVYSLPSTAPLGPSEKVFLSKCRLSIKQLENSLSFVSNIQSHSTTDGPDALKLKIENLYVLHKFGVKKLAWNDVPADKLLEIGNVNYLSAYLDSISQAFGYETAIKRLEELKAAGISEILEVKISETLINIHLANNNYESAKAIYSKLIKTNENHMLNTWIQCLANGGRFQEALDTFNEALDRPVFIIFSSTLSTMLKTAMKEDNAEVARELFQYVTRTIHLSALGSDYLKFCIEGNNRNEIIKTVKSYISQSKVPDVLTFSMSLEKLVEMGEADLAISFLFRSTVSNALETDNDLRDTWKMVIRKFLVKVEKANSWTPLRLCLIAQTLNSIPFAIVFPFGTKSTPGIDFLTHYWNYRKNNEDSLSTLTESLSWVIDLQCRALQFMYNSDRRMAVSKSQWNELTKNFAVLVSDVIENKIVLTHGTSNRVSKFLESNSYDQALIIKFNEYIQTNISNLAPKELSNESFLKFSFDISARVKGDVNRKIRNGVPASQILNYLKPLSDDDYVTHMATYLSIIRYCSNNKSLDVDTAIKVYELAQNSLKKIENFQISKYFEVELLNEIIPILASSNYTEAYEKYQDLLKLGMIPSIPAYNALIHYCPNGIEQVSTFVDEVLKNANTNTALSFITIIMRKYLALGEPQKSLDFYEKHLSPHKSTRYNDVIALKSYCAMEDFIGARAFISRVESDRYSDFSSYGCITLMEELVRFGTKQSAADSANIQADVQEMADHVLSGGIAVNVNFWSALLDSYLKLTPRNVSKAVELVGEIRRYGYIKSEWDCLIVSSFGIGEKDISKAIEYANSLKDLSKEGPTSAIYETLLNCCIMTGQVERTKEIVEMMSKNGVSLNDISQGLLIRGWSTVNLEKAKAIFTSAEASGSVGLYTIEALVRGLLNNKDREAAVELLENYEVLFKNQSAQKFKSLRKIIADFDLVTLSSGASEEEVTSVILKRCLESYVLKEPNYLK
ncbi:hypothetical protein NADFUDRAFT_76936 [Nadsonia fulvescens var. elongata DSM 6958]|uniref:Pentacotripeptide-repeat region of PRORP domain-containing protein n=1 Tax=Nadsonia fulvescens var. elongata DSM 6958 TaxID=857566 RepID=A0A1E3PV03_9ASCO|nr:hypothetical protein NADFUDRAFT_76936 [Nadsonia fulvescens var. elongata DSM 6958]